MTDKPLQCPHCQSPSVTRNGFHAATSSQKAFCRTCVKHFRTRYRHKASKPGTEKRIVSAISAGQSIRQVARSLGISPTTVFKTKQRGERLYQGRLNAPYSIPRNVRHVVLWSGGKDSSALLIWALEHLPADRLEVIFCDTGWESPITYRFIEEVSHRLLGGRLTVLRSNKYDSFIDLAEKKGRFPSPKARFCTEQLKVVPTIEWTLSQKEDLAMYQGIRAEESNTRSKMKQRDEYFHPHVEYLRNPFEYGAGGVLQRKRTPLYYRRVTQWLETHECTVERPLFYWKEKDVLDLCRRHRILNPLYDMGFKRVGCFPCIMESKQGICTLATKFPERIEEIAQAEQVLGSTLFPSQKIPERIAKIPRIQDVVTWAMENRSEEAEASVGCMSAFQRCE